MARTHCTAKRTRKGVTEVCTFEHKHDDHVPHVFWPAVREHRR